MQPITILDRSHFHLTLDRLCYQLIENHDDFRNSVLLGLQPRGVYLARQLKDGLERVLGGGPLAYGALDITFFRDDLRQKDAPIIPKETEIESSIEDKHVILVDDVLFTGRTIRAGLDAMLAYGRPRTVELLILVDRRFRRQLPIKPDYRGVTVDTVEEEMVSVEWTDGGGPEKVLLFTSKGADEQTEY